MSWSEEVLADVVKAYADVLGVGGRWYQLCQVLV